ncbi:carotenoid isomerooxygenase isoform X3 [Hermetia illucens]|nr:carotenoid isomerooxygenase isoform X3 [Hermetia illucens]
MQYQHLFDSAALLHRFGICNGQVTYQCRFIQTSTYKRNQAAQRIVYSEFGTKAVPDPCHSIFQRVSAIFKSVEDFDNTMISIYPFGDEYYAFTESPIIHKINPQTLETEKKVAVADYIGIASHTSHPHVMKDSTVFNLGVGVTSAGPVYHILCFPKGEHMFTDAHIVATIPCRWRLHPGYMHSFGISENYFLIIEQPLSISVAKWVKAQVSQNPLSSTLKWFKNEPTHFYLIERGNGKLKATYKTEALFYLHVINQFELENCVIVDICCYKDPAMLNCMYIESMKNMQTNPDYASMFRSRPLRFVLPVISAPAKKLTKSQSLTNMMSVFRPRFSLRRSETIFQEIKCGSPEERVDPGLQKKPLYDSIHLFSHSNAKAFKNPDGSIYVQPELLCDLGCETPRINYEKHSGVPYRYFYAISSDVDAENPGTLIKVDTETKSGMRWCETNCYPSEPIFIPTPNATAEDDGVILAAMVWGGSDENKVGLLVLCAKTWTELGRCEFQTPGPVPKCLHGWFAENK